MFFKKTISLFIAITFLTSSVYPNYARAELNLPGPSQFVPLSNIYSFPVLKGMKFDPVDPLKMEFIIDTADQKDISEEEASRLIRYFLAGLTIPEEDTWVNMSPYEADKIIPQRLSETDLGKDLLSQDYILKQLSSSLTYPESDTGKDFWARTYQEVLKIAKTTKLPVNTFNKIWIMPDKAVVYEHDNFAMVSEATLKTMLEEDYLALKNNLSSIQKQKNMKEGLINQVNEASSKVMRESILPKINADVNSGKNFATLRQIYYSLILGVWFKKKFKDSLYKAYINQGKVKGIDLADKGAKDKIYNLYVQAFKKGIYNYIKPEKDLGTGRNIKRQYFSGGFTALGVGENAVIEQVSETAMLPLGNPGSKKVEIKLGTGTNSPGANSASPVSLNEIKQFLRAIHWKIFRPGTGLINCSIDIKIETERGRTTYKVVGRETNNRVFHFYVPEHMNSLELLSDVLAVFDFREEGYLDATVRQQIENKIKGIKKQQSAASPEAASPDEGGIAASPVTLGKEEFLKEKAIGLLDEAYGKAVRAKDKEAQDSLWYLKGQLERESAFYFISGLGLLSRLNSHAQSLLSEVYKETQAKSVANLVKTWDFDTLEALLRKSTLPHNVVFLEKREDPRIKIYRTAMGDVRVKITDESLFFDINRKGGIFFENRDAKGRNLTVGFTNSSAYKEFRLRLNADESELQIKIGNSALKDFTRISGKTEPIVFKADKGLTVRIVGEFGGQSTVASPVENNFEAKSIRELEQEKKLLIRNLSKFPSESPERGELRSDLDELLQVLRNKRQQQGIGSSPMLQSTKGGIDLGDIDVAASPNSSPVNLPMIDLKNFQGFTFRIIRIEPITNFNAIFGATFMKVEGKAGKENLQLAYAK